MRWMTWRAISARPYMQVESSMLEAIRDSCKQGYTAGASTRPLLS